MQKAAIKQIGKPKENPDKSPIKTIEIPEPLQKRMDRVSQEAQQRIQQATQEITNQANHSIVLMVEGFLCSIGEEAQGWEIQPDFKSLKK